MSFHTIQWRENGIEILDQTKLPGRVRYVTLKSPEAVVKAIKTLAIRGAPAIGVAAAMGAALGARKIKAKTRQQFLTSFETLCSFIASARPTAVNLFWALERMRETARSSGETAHAITAALEDEALRIFHEDVEINRLIGEHGQALLDNGDVVLTHCNAGALATAGYGTALGVIRSAIGHGKQIGVIATETRPLLQGSRLTAWELTADGIDVTLITDNMAGHFLKEGLIKKIITGADRIASNGDVANKIGTYTLSVLAKEHRVPFIIAAPLSTFDASASTGFDIPIEERSPGEVTQFMGVACAPKGVKVKNPSFDVTPAAHVSAIVTERGIVNPPYPENIKTIIRGVRDGREHHRVRI